MEVNRLYNEDCLQTMQRMPSAFIDLVVTSPPYDGLRKYDGYEFNVSAVIKELHRVIKSGGVIVWVIGDQVIKGSETGTSFRQALAFMDAGFKLHDTMIYRKKNFIPQTMRRYEQEFEYMFCFVKDKIKTFNPQLIPSKTAGSSKNFAHAGYPWHLRAGGSQRRRDEIITVKENKIPGNIFSYGTGSNKTGHPAPFPEQLAEDQILTWSNPGNLIYDPCAGSGTTWKMALVNGRKFIGSEVSEKYCEIANNRIFDYMIT